MDDRKRQGKSTENVDLVSKVKPLKPISCGHCGKPGHIITNCWLGGKTPCEHCGKFNHKSEDCRCNKFGGLSPPGCHIPVGYEVGVAGGPRPIYLLYFSLFLMAVSTRRN